MTNVNKGKIRIVVGGNWGSEAKGQCVEHLAKNGLMDICVRTGAINAGHTVYYNGTPYAMQTVPAGWVGGKNIKLVIGRGAFIKESILRNEIEMVKKALGVDKLELYIDPMAGTHTAEHEKFEVTLHKRMGSTGKGCMAASQEKMARDFDYKNFGDTEYAKKFNGSEFTLIDTVELMNNAYDAGAQIVLEGTQGTLLDLFHGDFPYVTSRSTIAANWLMEAGLSPTLDIDVWMVIRTFPIRVAGNSGPLPDEISWSELAREIGLESLGLLESDVVAFEEAEKEVIRDWQLPAAPHLMSSASRVNNSAELSEFHTEVMNRLAPETVINLKKFFEMTTVTKKLRRIGRLSQDQLRRAALLNRPTHLFVTFMNYLVPQVKGMTEWDQVKGLGEVSEKIVKFIKDCEESTGAPVMFIGTDRQTWVKVPQGAERRFN